MVFMRLFRLILLFCAILRLDATCIIKENQGSYAQEHYKEMWELCNVVYSEYPYMYTAAEKEYAYTYYLDSLAISQGSKIVCIFDKEKLVGFATGIRMSDYKAAHYKAPISDPAAFFYIADLVLLPEYRGNGLEYAMVQALEAHARLDSSYKQIAYLLINEAERTKYRKPAHVYSPYFAPFWEERGYKVSNVCFVTNFEIVGETSDTPHIMTYVTKELAVAVDEALKLETYKKNAYKYSKNQLQEIEQALLHPQQERQRLVSFNMLVNDRDSTHWKEEHRWVKRLPRIVSLIDQMHPHIIAAQELLPSQLDDVVEKIGDTYNYYGKSRPSNGEYTGIFYKTDRYKLLEATSLDIPETQNCLVMVALQDTISQKAFAVFTIHFAWDINTREKEASITSQTIDEYVATHSIPVFLAGDLNTFPHRQDEDYPCFDGDYINRILTKKTLTDARSLALCGHFGPISTFTNAPGDKAPFTGTGSPGVFLDHIYVSDGITVLTHAVQDAKVDGHFASDHMPVFIDYVLH